MRTRAVAVVLLLILISATPIPAEDLSSVDSIDDPLVDWEGEDTPTYVYEGVLSDPQDIDNISLGNEIGVVHSIHLVHADQPRPPLSATFSKQYTGICSAETYSVARLAQTIRRPQAAAN